eukprot:5189313-Ditylum_brightwellii.AAC.1
MGALWAVGAVFIVAFRVGINSRNKACCLHDLLILRSSGGGGVMQLFVSIDVDMARRHASKAVIWPVTPNLLACCCIRCSACRDVMRSKSSGGKRQCGM